MRHHPLLSSCSSHAKASWFLKLMFKANTECRVKSSGIVSAGSSIIDEIHKKRIVVNFDLYVEATTRYVLFRIDWPWKKITFFMDLIDDNFPWWRCKSCQKEKLAESMNSFSSSISFQWCLGSRNSSSSVSLAQWQTTLIKWFVCLKNHWEEHFHFSHINFLIGMRRLIKRKNWASF